MGVRIVHQDDPQGCADRDYVRVSTSADPNDDTVTLATIQRIVEKPTATLDTNQNWHIKTLVMDQPMMLTDALGLATLYAERKGIPVVYSD